MHVGMVHITERSFPPDIRIEKEAHALAREGFKVTVLTAKHSEDELDYERISENFYVRRFQFPQVAFHSRLISKFTLNCKGLVPVIERFLTADRPDALHVHDFNFVPSVLMAACQSNVPIIADLHENMPAALKAYRSGLPPVKKLKRYILDNDSLWRYHERRYLPRCDRIIVVVPEAAERLRAYGIAQDRIEVVSNSEDESTFAFDSDQCDKDITDKYASHWMVSYIGGIGPHRGIDTVLKSVPLLQTRIDNFRLVIVGATGNQKKTLEDYARKLGIERSVEIIGWLPFDRVNSYVLASQVCLVPHNDFEHTQTTVPHKLFQYMICGKPVLVSDCRPLARIVNDTGAGYVFRANSPHDFADRLIHIHKNPDEARSRGLSGKQAALGEYAWRHDAARLTNMYRDLIDFQKQEVLKV